MTSRRDLLAGAAALSATLAFSSGARSQASSPPLPVVATFAILADFVARVGADRVVLTSLVAPGADAHVYSPTPADSRALAAARLVFVNGLGFEGWVNRLIASSGTKATIVTATAGVRPLKAEEGGQGHSHGSGGHGEVDPHAWQSVANAKIYVANIAAALISADPAGKDGFEARAKAYGTELDALDAEIRAGIARIPAARRRIITSHDAFQYFEKAYGIDFASPRGLSTSAEPSPQAVGRIIRQIKAEKIPAVFIENLSDERLMKRIADETGARIGGTLYADTLTPAGGPASTYIEMMRHNLRQLTAALA
ncbi:MAG: metal ABC transporter substrate-binding protein [Hyphomicrobiales bacterium]|nr:metal ABC transporter substrate-binding protein [Hyphomicrobiales bacterium]